jgi:hypothetical protein
VLGFPRLERVVDLLRHEPGKPIPVGDAERLHQVPGRPVRDADVADLPGLDQRVERREGLLERGPSVPAVHLQEVDVVGPEPPQAALTARDDVSAREAEVVRLPGGPEEDLRRDHRLVAPGAQGFAEQLLAVTVAVRLGGVEEVDAGVERDRDLPRRALPVDRAELLVGAPPGRAEPDHRHREPGPAERSILHAVTSERRRLDDNVPRPRDVWSQRTVTSVWFSFSSSPSAERTDIATR